MKQKPPSTQALRHRNGVIDQRQQQIDPAGKYRVDPNDAAKWSQKQPGERLHDPHGTPAPAEAPDQNPNAKGDQAGSAHVPAEFDDVNPQKHGLAGPKEPRPPNTPKDDR